MIGQGCWSRCQSDLWLNYIASCWGTDLLVHSTIWGTVKRDHVYAEPIPYSGSMVVPSSVWRGQDYWTGPNHTGKYWEPVLRLTLCVRHLSAGTWVTIKSPKSLGASHLRWYFLCKLTLIHWSAGVSITLKNQVFCKAWFRGVSFPSVAW